MEETNWVYWTVLIVVAFVIGAISGAAIHNGWSWLVGAVGAIIWSIVWMLAWEAFFIKKDAPVIEDAPAPPEPGDDGWKKV